MVLLPVMEKAPVLPAIASHTAPSASPPYFSSAYSSSSFMSSPILLQPGPSHNQLLHSFLTPLPPFLPTPSSLPHINSSFTSLPVTKQILGMFCGDPHYRAGGGGGCQATPT